MAVRPGFTVTNENAPAVAAICARLHGMPLAIELAAARIKLLSPEAILGRLEHQLDLLAAGARDLPPRQQTLRAAIAWSYDILDEDAKRLLDRLSVFASGFDLASAEAICGPSAEIGGDIVDGRDGPARPEPRSSPRRWPAARRGSGSWTRSASTPRSSSRPAARPPSSRHAIATGTWRWPPRPPRSCPAPTSDAGSTASSSSTTTSGPSSTAPSPSPTRRSRSAWRSRCGASGRSTATSPRRGSRLEAMAATPWSHDDPRLRAKLMEALGGTCWWQGQVVPMGALLPGGARPVARHRRRGRDRQRVLQRVVHVRGLARRPARRRRSRCRPGWPGLHLPREGARRSTTGSATGAARRTRCGGMGNYRYFRRDPGLGIDENRQALEIFREVGDRTMEAWALHMLGTGLLRSGDPVEARTHVEHAIRHFYAAGDAAGLTLTLDDLSAIAVVGGRPAACRAIARRGAEPHDRDRGRARRLRRGLLRGGHAAQRPRPHVRVRRRPIRSGRRGHDRRRGDRLCARGRGR